MTGYLDIKELSDFLGIKRSTLYAWAAQGKIPCYKIHRLIRFRLEEIEPWVERFRKEASKPGSIGQKGRRNPDVDRLIARARRAVYTPRRGETRPKSSPIGKEVPDGAV